MVRFFALLIVIGLPLVAKDPKRQMQVSTTSHVSLADGKTISFIGSVGALNVEGWDEPQVQITLTRYTFTDQTPKDKRKADRHLEQIGVKATPEANGNLLIATTIPHREWPGRMLRGRTNMTLTYRVMVPRNSHLIIRHGNGDVVVYNVAGDIDARMHNGGMVIQAPEAEKYVIDARCKIGGVTALDHSGQSHKTSFINDHFIANEAGAKHHMNLRVGAGGIDIVDTGAMPVPVKSM